MEQLNTFQKRCVLNVAKSVAPIYKKMETILTKIKTLNEEMDSLSAQINAMEDTIKPFTGGYTSNDLVNRTVKNGIAMYTFKYPDTILPVENQEGLYNLFVVKTKELIYQSGDENYLRRTQIRYNDTLNGKYQWRIISGGENSEYIRLTNTELSDRFIAFNKGNGSIVPRFSSYKASSGQADIMLYKVELITNPNDDSLNYISSIE